MTDRVVTIRVGNDDRQVVITAVQRQLATTLFGTYVALVDAGFTDAAALTIITATVSSASLNAD